MKTIKSLICGIFVTAFVLSAHADGTNTASTTDTNITAQSVLNSAKEVAATNLNQVMIEILSGVKSASSEIYSASKDAIHKSVDFVSAQAPDVVKQFLAWKFYEALSSILLWTLVAGFVYFISYRCYRYQKTASTTDGHGEDDLSSSDVGGVAKWVFGVIASLILLLAVGNNIDTLVKIKVAPKVYVIEYVVNLAKEARR